MQIVVPLALFTLFIQAPLAFAADDAATQVDRMKVDTKKSARKVKSATKQELRKVRGDESALEDSKDKMSDTLENSKDEMKHLDKKLSD